LSILEKKSVLLIFVDIIPFSQVDEVPESL